MHRRRRARRHRERLMNFEYLTVHVHQNASWNRLREMRLHGWHAVAVEPRAAEGWSGWTFVMKRERSAFCEPNTGRL